MCFLVISGQNVWFFGHFWPKVVVFGVILAKSRGFLVSFWPKCVVFGVFLAKMCDFGVFLAKQWVISGPNSGLFLAWTLGKPESPRWCFGNRVLGGGFDKVVVLTKKWVFDEKVHF